MKTFLEYFNEGKIDVNSSFVGEYLEKVKEDLIDADDVYEAEDILNYVFKKKRIEFTEGDTPSNIKRFIDAGIQGAEYDLEENKIFLMYNPKTFLKAVKNEKRWETFKSLAIELIDHELVHQAQNSKMKTAMGKTGFKDKLEKNLKKKRKDTGYDEYYQDKNEVSAYAKEAVHELKTKGYDNEGILKILKNPKSSNDSEVISMYHQLYKLGSIKKEVFNRFLKKVEEYLR